MSDNFISGLGCIVQGAHRLGYDDHTIDKEEAYARKVAKQKVDNIHVLSKGVGHNSDFDDKMGTLRKD